MSRSRIPMLVLFASFVGGSYATWNAIAKLTGQRGAIDYVMAANRFSTDGYRDHSAATRDLANINAAFDDVDATDHTDVAGGVVL